MEHIQVIKQNDPALKLYHCWSETNWFFVDGFEKTVIDWMVDDRQIPLITDPKLIKDHEHYDEDGLLGAMTSADMLFTFQEAEAFAKVLAAGELRLEIKGRGPVTVDFLVNDGLDLLKEEHRLPIDIRAGSLGELWSGREDGGLYAEVVSLCDDKHVLPFRVIGYYDAEKSLGAAKRRIRHAMNKWVDDRFYDKRLLNELETVCKCHGWVPAVGPDPRLDRRLRAQQGTEIKQ